MSERTNRRSKRPNMMGPPGGGPGGAMGLEKPKNFKGAVLRLLAYMGKYRAATFAVIVIAVLSTVFSILGPGIMAQATDELATGLVAMILGTGGINMAAIQRVLIIMIGLYALSALLSYIQRWVMSTVAVKVTYNMRRDISKKIHNIPLKYIEGTSRGDILSRITNDMDLISQSLSQSVIQVVSSVTMVIGVIVMMFTISPILTLAVLVLTPLSLLISTRVMKRSRKYFADQQKYLGELNGQIEESFSGHNVIRGFNAENKQIQIFDELNKNLNVSARTAQFLSGLVMPAVQFIGNVIYVIVCVVGAYFAGKGTMTIGGIQAFIIYVRNFNQPLSQMAQIVNQLQQTAVAAERVFEFLDEPEEVAEEENPVHVKYENGEMTLVIPRQGGGDTHHRFNGNVEFVNVSFGYEEDKEVIHNFSAFIPAGEKVAIVGHTGAGKTTIIKLLMRFYDVDSGQILLDGVDIRRFTRHDLRSLFGMVLQDTWLYSDTIEENIRYGRRDAKNDEIRAAAKTARADHFIRTLAGGYGMMVDEEADNVSAGQKQLLTIARAILADPEILILDEATSSVDTKTEVDIQKGMNALMQNRTSFIIAHRLSTIRDCGIILMMENGDIVEQGSHKELLDLNGKYAELYNSQFEL